MFTDFVVPVASADVDAFDPEYPYQAIQVHLRRSYPDPPFASRAASGKPFGERPIPMAAGSSSPAQSFDRPEVAPPARAATWRRRIVLLLFSSCSTLDGGRQGAELLQK